MKMLTPATPGQLRQISRVGADAIEKVLADFGLDNPGAQRVHAHGDKFAEVIRTATVAALNDLSVSDKYANEEVESECSYPSGYNPNGLTDQCNDLRTLFPGIGFANHDLLTKIENG